MGAQGFTCGFTWPILSLGRSQFLEIYSSYWSALSRENPLLIWANTTSSIISSNCFTSIYGCCFICLGCLRFTFSSIISSNCFCLGCLRLGIIGFICFGFSCLGCLRFTCICF